MMSPFRGFPVRRWRELAHKTPKCRGSQHGWSEHRAQRLGAALAFYTTLALAPLTIIAIAVAGYFFGEEAARGGIVDQIEHLVGRDGAIAIEALIQKASEPHQSRIATVISIGLLVFGATGVFAELKDSLDTIWEVKRKPGLGLWTMFTTQLRTDVPITTTHVGSETKTGLGDIYGQVLLIPYVNRRFAFVTGTGLVLPTATYRTLGLGKWQLAPLAVPVWFFLYCPRSLT